MREIKFRAWDWEKVIYPDDIYIDMDWDTYKSYQGEYGEVIAPFIKEIVAMRLNIIIK